MTDRTLHPSMKSVQAAYLLAAVIFGVAIWAYYKYGQDAPGWLRPAALVVFLPPLIKDMRRRMITLRLHDDHLALESGLFSRTRRTVDMAKIQDVTVRQTFGQRLIGVGDLVLETAGESGHIGILNVDRPREIADEIIAGSKRSSALRGQGNLSGPSGA